MQPGYKSKLRPALAGFWAQPELLQLENDSTRGYDSHPDSCTFSKAQPDMLLVLGFNDGTVSVDVSF